MNALEKKVPTIRFKEFTEDYKEYRLSKLLNRYSENNKDEEFSIEEILSLSSHYGIVNRRELLEDTYSKVNHRNYLKTRLNDFVYGKSISAGNPYGLFKVNNYKDGLLSTLYFTFKVSNIVEPIYLDVYFSHQNRANNFLKKYVLVGDRYITADANYILSGKIFIPSKQEQQKVAQFLATIDTRIQTLEKKKSLLEQYKKGVMQKIFKQEMRFKDADDNEFPDWEKKKGNFLFNSISDKNHNSDLPILAVTQDQGAIPRDMIDYNIGVTAKSISSYKVVQKGDFIISLRSFQGGIEYSNYKGICSPAYIVLRPVKELNKEFYKFYLKTPSYITELNKKLEGIRDGKMISYKYFSDIKLPFPCLEEQTKIANFISAIDKKIELTNQQIEHTKAYKKGLLQQMFV